MEDAHIMTGDLAPLPGCSFFTVFDGHGGNLVSTTSEARLLPTLFATPTFQLVDKVTYEGLHTALHDAFINLDRELRTDPKLSSGEDVSGSTATTVLVTPTNIIFANLGDSRSLLVRNGKVFFATEDHKPSNEHESKRIVAAGGRVVLGRVNGTLAVSRALGDFNYKTATTLHTNAQMVSPVPHINAMPREDTDEFLVLACDGIWDVLTCDQVANFIADHLKAGIDAREICERCLDYCLHKGSKDNMSIVLVLFPNAPKRVAGFDQSHEFLSKYAESTPQHTPETPSPFDIEVLKQAHTVAVASDRIFVTRDAESSVYKQVSKVLEQRGWQQMEPDYPKYHVILAERGFPWGRIGHVGHLVQTINYYRGYTDLCRKASLVRTIRSICSEPSFASGESSLVFTDIMPASFLIRPNDSNDESMEERRQFLETATTYASQGNMAWIAKASAGAKGEAIKLSTDPAEILAFIDTKKQTHVVQKYVENPLLLPGNRKFDIRCWVLVDSKFDVHCFNEGVVRTSADEYDPHSFESLTAHITNHCIQEQHSANYGKYELGNEMFFEEFGRFLDSKGISLKDSVLPQMHKIVKLCFQASAEKLKIDFATHHYNSFHLFGFDFLIDDGGKAWLLEINGSPACAAALLDRLCEGIVSVAIDPLYPPKSPVTSPNMFTRL